jgi:mono/diheme cytochrome c family protein
LSTERLVVLALAALVAGCRQDMHDQPKYRPLRPSTFFRDARGSRPLVPGTVARGQIAEGAGPPPVTPPVLRRGQERFDIYCAPCHDRVGTGNGMIVQRGFKRPPSLHVDRLRQTRDAYLFEVITEGFGVMPSYAAQVPAEDRWAITAYIRALQLSQNARLDDVPPAERSGLEAGGE